MGSLFGTRSDNPHRTGQDGLYMSEEWNESTTSARATRKILEHLQKYHIHVCYVPCGPLTEKGGFRSGLDSEAFVWEAEAFAAKHEHPFRLLAHVPQREGRFVDPSDPVAFDNLRRCADKLQLLSGVCFELLPTTEPGLMGVLGAVSRLSDEFPKLELQVVAQLSWLQWPEHCARLHQVVHQLEVSLVNPALAGTDYEHWCAQQVNHCIGLLGSERLAFRVAGSGARGTAAPRHALQGIRRGCEIQRARVGINLHGETTMTAADWADWRRSW